MAPTNGFARVETVPGEWTDIAQHDYEAASYAPPFWDLPIQNDHQQALRANFIRLPVADVIWDRFMRWSILAAGATLIIIMILYFSGVIPLRLGQPKTRSTRASRPSAWRIVWLRGR